MLKRTLLGSAILLAGTPALATPYMPMDARGLAMGNTGVASARLAHAPAYNPSLLSHRRDGDNFALLFPQIGINLADEEEVIDKGEEIGDDIMPRFADLFDDSVPGNLPDAVTNLGTAADDLATAIENNGDVAGASADFAAAISETQSVVSDLNSASSDLTDSLDAISGSPLRGRFGISAAMAIPNDLIAIAVSARADANFSARSIFTDQDQNNILAYGQATSEYLEAAATANTLVAALDENSTQAEAEAAAAALDNLVNFESVSSVTDNSGSSPVFENGDISTAAEDPSFNSKVEIAAIAVAEVGLTLSKALEVEGRKFALGVTPKIQAVSTYHYVGQMDEDDNPQEVELEDSERSENHLNLDIGTAFYVDDMHKIRVGVVIQDLISKDFELADVPVDGNGNGEVAEGGKVSIKPKVRAGVAYEGGWYNVAADLDITENEPLAYEDATQYLSIGGELDAFGWAQLRAGYRTNLAGDNNVVSLGAGVSPFGVHLDLALMADIAKPEKEFGAAMEFGFYF